MQTKTITSVKQSDVDSLQRVGVPVFKRLGPDVSPKQRYFAEVVQVDSANICRGVKTRRRKLSPAAKLRLSSNVPTFERPKSNVAMVYVAFRNACRPDKSKPIARDKATKAICKATGLTSDQVSASLSSLITRYAALEVVG